MSTIVLSAVFAGIIFLGFSFYDYVVFPFLASKVNRRLPDRPQRLQKLLLKDKMYIIFAKLVTVLFIYHTYSFVMDTKFSCVCVDILNITALLSSVKWMPLHLAALFIIYDFFYTLFHWALHWPPIYPFIHKHHHRQVTPFRGIADSINDHPIEYVTGEYLHLFVIYLLTRVVPANQIHALTVVVFIFISGMLAGLNHTRIDIRLPYLFNVRAHDLHHYQFKYNYGQYIMFWDWVFGTYKAFE